MIRSLPTLTTLASTLAFASAVSAARLPAQCADGSPPPCGRPAARPAPPAANSVAVLYFDARDTADAYLADGLTEDVTSLLGSVARVRVKSPGVVRRAQRASPGDAPAIARALGVHYLLDGNVRRVGTRVRVSTRLLNGATAVAAWGDVFDRTPEELLALPSVIAREVATRVGGSAPSSETSALGTLRTHNAAAYDHFLRGNFFLALRSPEGITRALAEYREAERLDSGFAAAIGRAAYAYAIARGNYYPLPDAPLESLVGRGLGVADRALRRDSTSSDAWMARGFRLATPTVVAVVGPPGGGRRARRPGRRRAGQPAAARGCRGGKRARLGPRPCRRQHARGGVDRPLARPDRPLGRHGRAAGGRRYRGDLGALRAGGAESGLLDKATPARIRCPARQSAL